MEKIRGIGNKLKRVSDFKLKNNIWKIVLWCVILVVAILGMKNVINGKSIYISINYAPYGTTQNQAKLEYGKGIFKYATQEKVEDFKVTFKVSANRIEDAVIRIGDQSGTVQIESIEILSDYQYILLSGEEILDYFTFDQIDRCEIKDEWVEIFSYNIERSELRASAALTDSIATVSGEHTGAIVLFFVVICVILVFVLQKGKRSKYINELKHKLIIYLKTEDKKIFIITGVLAILGCMIFSEHISDFVFNNMVKYHNIIISNLYLREEGSENTLKVFDNQYEEINSPICVGNIVDEKRYGFYDFAKLRNAVVEARNISVIEESESAYYGYGYFDFLQEDSYLVLSLPVYPNTCLTLSVDDNKYSTNIRDVISGYTRVVAYENATEAGIIKIYPYDLADYMYVLVDYLVVYVFLFIILCCIILAGAKMLTYFLYKNKFMSEYNPMAVFVIISVLYAVLTSVIYYFNLRDWQASPIADVYYYMNPQILDENGHFSLQVTAEYIVGFRGYFSIVIAIAAKGLEVLTGIKMIYFYFLYYGILVAFTIGIAMPKLYEYFTDKRANNAMCLLMFLIFSLFWYPFFFYALVDIPAAMCAISAIAYMLSGLKRADTKEMLGGGILFGIALSYRMAYKYILAVVVVWIIVEIVIKLYKKEINWKKTALIIGGLFLGLIIVAFPQFILNYEKGHIGLFPYSEGRGYDVNSNSEFSLTWGSFTRGFHMYNLGQEANVDKQLARIDQFYYMNKLYSAGDLIYIVLSNPIEFCVGYFKHLFWAMSAETEAAYREEPIPIWLRTIASLLNYALIGEYLLIFINHEKNKLLKIKDEILILLLTISSICIQNLSHIERRYFLFYYLFIYFVMAFIFQDYIRQKRNGSNKVNLQHFIIMICFILGCCIFKETIRYNFMG